MDVQGQLLGRFRYESQQNHTVHPGCPFTKNQLAKVLVKSKDDPLLGDGTVHNLQVIHPGAINGNPGNIMTRLPKQLHRLLGNIFISKKAHGSVLQEIHPLGAQDFRGIG